MITFRSEVGPDVMMFDDIARRMMELMGKEQAAQGIVTVEQLPAAIAALERAIAQDRAAQHGTAATEEDDDAAPAAAPVSLAQRAVPLVELLKISLARDKPVTWGV
jgi:hypothetical protein